MALDLDSNRTAGLDPLLAMLRGRQHVEAAMDSTVGPMPVKLFFDKFLPAGVKARNTQLSPKDAFKRVPQRANSVAQICNPLASALNRKTRSKARCPGYVFAKTNERSIRPERLGYAKPHICCFTPENLNHVARADPDSRIELGYAEFFIQVVKGPDYDFFQDPDPSADPEAAQKHDMMRQFPIDYSDPDPSRYQHFVDQHEAINRAFGLHIAFATEIFARQHRVFLYSVSVAGSIARFFRWERVGCIATGAFEIRAKLP
ncbi:hypothetical protein NUW54_g1574 [Trametes sanguinea]|uniref:Uncharacterized protein n=1 Tax=Trametes sanguinea TaxID=158606 RepID=A0ACC1Q6L2_9APHY|nr:hypothetical protein NUW54_g1574 [Trametes sanguinea]